MMAAPALQITRPTWQRWFQQYEDHMMWPSLLSGGVVREAPTSTRAFNDLSVTVRHSPKRNQSLVLQPTKTNIRRWTTILKKTLVTSCVDRILFFQRRLLKFLVLEIHGETGHWMLYCHSVASRWLFISQFSLSTSESNFGIYGATILLDKKGWEESN